MSEDELRDVPGYPGYRVTRDGHIKGPSGRWLIGSRHKHGYRVVWSRGRATQGLGVHVAVLLAWVGPRPPGYVARHLDGDPTNNSVENLKWGTQAENWADKRLHGRATVGVRHGRAKLNEERASVIKRRLLDGCDRRELAREFGVSLSTIAHIATGRKWGWVHPAISA